MVRSFAVKINNEPVVASLAEMDHNRREGESPYPFPYFSEATPRILFVRDVTDVALSTQLFRHS